MTWLDTILEHDELIRVIGAVLLAIIAWISGAGRWLGRQIEKSLDERRERQRRTPMLPEKTLHVTPDRGLFPPTWMKHDFGKGHVATRCGTFLLITNLLQTPVLPNSAQVKLRGWSRFRRKVYSIDLGGLGSVRHGAAIAPTSTAKFHVSFIVLPEIKAGSLVADITIIDQFGNSHTVKGVRFTNEQPHALPWDVPTS